MELICVYSCVVRAKKISLPKVSVCNFILSVCELIYLGFVLSLICFSPHLLSQLYLFFLPSLRFNEQIFSTLLLLQVAGWNSNQCTWKSRWGGWGWCRWQQWGRWGGRSWWGFCRWCWWWWWGWRSYPASHPAKHERRDLMVGCKSSFSSSSSLLLLLSSSRMALELAFLVIFDIYRHFCPPKMHFWANIGFVVIIMFNIIISSVTQPLSLGDDNSCTVMCFSVSLLY